MSTPGRLVILSGPSCAGKTPLDKALQRFYPELRRRLRLVVLYNDRAARPGEADGVDYHFRSRAEIEALDGDDRYVVMEVRGDLQALDLVELDGLLSRGDAFFEGNPFIARTLQTHPRLQQVRRLSVYMAPLSREEILFLRDPERRVSLPELVTDLMRRRLLRRTRHQKGELTAADLAEVGRRAGSACGELTQAHHYDWVIPNHDGEDSENWDAFACPLGDARRALLTFAALLRGEDAPWAEKWEADLLPD